MAIDDWSVVADGPLFSFELCAMSLSFINEHCCLVKRLGVLEILPTLSDIVIGNISQLFSYIVWPHILSISSPIPKEIQS